MSIKITKGSFNKINTVLSELGRSYHDAIPLDTIFSAVRNQGMVPLQEDNTEWDGFLCGAEGRCVIPVGDAITKTVVNGLDTYEPFRKHAILLTWYKMPSGRYEIVSYIS